MGDFWLNSQGFFIHQLRPWWGCISASGVGDIVRIDGITNADEYRQVLICVIAKQHTTVIPKSRTLFV